MLQPGDQQLEERITAQTSEIQGLVVLVSAPVDVWPAPVVGNDRVHSSATDQFRYRISGRSCPPSATHSRSRDVLRRCVRVHTTAQRRRHSSRRARAPADAACSRRRAWLGYRGAASARNLKGRLGAGVERRRGRRTACVRGHPVIPSVAAERVDAGVALLELRRWRPRSRSPVRTREPAAADDGIGPDSLQLSRQ